MANSEQIDGTTLSLVLSATREILPAAIYQQALNKSELEKFGAELPPANREKVANTTQLMAFWQAVYERVNFATFKLILRNVGGQMAQISQSWPAAVERRTEIAALPRTERLAATMQLISNSLNGRGLHVKYEPHEQGFWLYFDYCPFICHHVRSQEPICHIYEYMFLKILKGYSKLPLVSEEIECIAMGGTACRYYFHEINPTGQV